MEREKWGVANHGEALSLHCSVKTKSTAEQTRLAKDRCILYCNYYRTFHAINQFSLCNCGMCLITHPFLNKRYFQGTCTCTSGYNSLFQIVCNHLIFKFDFLSHNKRAVVVLFKIFNRDGFDNFISLIKCLRTHSVCRNSHIFKCCPTQKPNVSCHFLFFLKFFLKGKENSSYLQNTRGLFYFKCFSEITLSWTVD